MRDDQERLQDILDAIERIGKYSGEGRGLFERDELVQVWLVHHVQVIGEAAAQLTAETRERLPNVPLARYHRDAQFRCPRVFSGGLG
jgi:uncharacterized protein with HEPN domain